MCRNTLSVGWDGRLYDCDFNLAAGSVSFAPGETARLTRSGLLMALTALAMWWSCNAFIPVVSGNLALAQARADLARFEQDVETIVREFTHSIK